MRSDTSPIVKAVSAGDIDATRACLERATSPNLTIAGLPLVTYAARIPNAGLFRLLVSYGAQVPHDILRHIITWELPDWRILTEEDEAQVIAILNDLRSTSAWLPAEQRRELVEKLKEWLEDGEFEDIIAALLQERDPGAQ